MTDQTNELRRINWSECFAFTNIFKTFRMAISPTKLLLAMAGLLLMGFCGWFLDAIWSSKHQAVKGAVVEYVVRGGAGMHRDGNREALAKRLRVLYQEMGGVGADQINKVADRFKDNPNGAVDDAIADLDLRSQFAAEMGLLEAAAAEKADRGKAYREQKARIARDKNRVAGELEALRPQGVFRTFLSYETECVYQMLDAARVLNFTNLLVPTITSGSGGLKDAGPWADVPASVLNVKDAESKELSIKTGPNGFGVLPSIFLMLRGLQWLMFEHGFFALLFLVFSLAIWSLFGGAICRVAAMNFARDEQVGFKTALAFAGRRFLGFFSAPLLPVAMVAGIGVCLFIGGLFLSIPYVGELVGGLLTGLALLGGFLIALIVLGAVGGAGLMWPTIAVEGSDAFDAISRSYSYLYSRPWRTAFYALVATVYGAFCYLFVRFFVLVVLKSTQFFVGWGTRWTYRPGTGSASGTKLDAMWPKASFNDLYLSPPAFGAEGWDKVGAVLIGIWAILLVMLLCAYLVSFLFSGSTIIYYLLRREVDATDISEVFVEEEPESPEALGAVSPAAPSEAPPTPAPSEPAGGDSGGEVTPPAPADPAG
ncbi:MAG: hypothetical protein QUV05_01390 [Phycisphaerae bacterium]|nr:hypothetical protein [Phycisphaerae bacterium]